MKNIRNILKKLLKLLESHLNLVSLIVFVMIVLYASWLLYNFVYLTVSRSPEISFKKAEIKREIFERIAKRLDLREENIKKAMNKNYPDIFK